MDLIMIRPWKVHNRLNSRYVSFHEFILSVVNTCDFPVLITSKCHVCSYLFTGKFPSLIFNFLQTVEWKSLPQTTFKYYKYRPCNSWTHKPQMKIRKKRDSLYIIQKQNETSLLYVSVSESWQEIQSRVREGTKSLTGLFFHKERQIGGQ